MGVRGWKLWRRPLPPLLAEGDVTQYDSQWLFLAQHSVAMLALKMLFTIQNNAGATMSQLCFALTIVASHADVLRGSSRVPAPRSLGRNAWRTHKNVCVGGYNNRCCDSACNTNLKLGQKAQRGRGWSERKEKEPLGNSWLLIKIHTFGYTQGWEE